MVTYTPVAPQGMSPFGDWFNELFRLWAARWQVWVLQGLIYFAITVLPAMLFYLFGILGMVMMRAGAGGNEPDPAVFLTTMGLFYGVVFLGLIFAQLLAPGMIITALKQMRGQAISVGDLFSGMRYFWGAMAVGIVTALGTCLCFVGAYAFMALLYLAVPLMVDRQLPTGEAISVSWNTTKTNFWLYLAYAFVVAILASVGSMACYIGMVATIPFMFIGQAIAYERTFNGPAATYIAPGQGTVPPPPYVPQDTSGQVFTESNPQAGSNVPRRVADEQEKPRE